MHPRRQLSIIKIHMTSNKNNRSAVLFIHGLGTTIKQLFNPSQCLIIAFSLLVVTGCEEKRSHTIGFDEQPCGITPELRKELKRLKKYSWSESGPDNLYLVRSHKVKYDEMGREYNPFGCVDKDREEVVPLKYKSGFFGPNVICVQSKDNKYGMFDLKGKEIAPCIYDNIDFFYGKYTIVKQNNKYGVMNNRGEIVVPVQYDQIRQFYEHYGNLGTKKYKFEDVFCLTKDGKVSVANISRDLEGYNGKHIDTPYDFKRVEKNGKSGFVNYLGEEIPCKYENARDYFSQGLAAVVLNKKVGFVDKKGDVKIPFKFDYTEYKFNFYSSHFAVFSEGLAAMMKGGKWGYIDKNGNTVIPFVYDWADRFHNGSAIVGKIIEGQVKYGMINKQNSVISPFEFENGRFEGSVYSNDNVFCMCKNGKWGVYSPMGKCLTPCQYDMIGNFVGYATVGIEGKQGLIDNQGRLLIPCEYKTCMYDAWSKAVYVAKNGKWGVLDTKNQKLVPLEFDEVYVCQNSKANLFIVKKDNETGWLDLCGNYIKTNHHIK